jgi:hypothetical protein
MQTVEIEIFEYSELDDAGKSRAREWFSQGGYTWIDEGIDSVKAFCQHFGVDLKDYSISPYSPSYIDTNVENHHFRGLTLKQVDKNRSLELTGYCLDCDLLETMYTVMKQTGNALLAFNEAIEAGLKGIISEMEYQDSEEYITEMMEINEYKFDAYGRIYH